MANVDENAERAVLAAIESLSNMLTDKPSRCSESAIGGVAAGVKALAETLPTLRSYRLAVRGERGR